LLKEIAKQVSADNGERDALKAFACQEGPTGEGASRLFFCGLASCRLAGWGDGDPERSG
jgi:hypothetical protein